MSEMLPLPEAVQLPPPAATHVHVTPVSVAGKVSATVAPVTAEGPALEATMVYVTLLPGITAKVLGDRLSALEARGLLVRPALGGVAAYALSASGHGLLAVLDQLEGWARHAPPA